MDEARAVLARLERIEQLERRGAIAGELLAELRLLVAEAEAWVGVEGPGTERARAALERTRDSLAEPAATRRGMGGR